METPGTFRRGTLTLLTPRSLPSRVLGPFKGTLAVGDMQSRVGGQMHQEFNRYCGWTKSCTTSSHGKPLFVAIGRGILVPAFLSAGFRPSTVSRILTSNSPCTFTIKPIACIGKWAKNSHGRLAGSSSGRMQHRWILQMHDDYQHLQKK